MGARSGLSGAYAAARSKDLDATTMVPGTGWSLLLQSATCGDAVDAAMTTVGERDGVAPGCSAIVVTIGLTSTPRNNGGPTTPPSSLGEDG